MRQSRYRWVVVAACATGLVFSMSPLFFNTLPVFMKAIAAETGWGRTQIIAGISMATLVTSLSSPLIGRLVDRRGPRFVVAIGLIPFVLAIASLRFAASSYPLYLAICAIAGLAGNCLQTFIYLSFMPRWFDRRLGLSLGLAATGIGIGQTLNPIYASTLAAAIGWRNGFTVLAATSLVVTGLLVLFVLRDGPAAIAGHVSKPDPAAHIGLTSRQALGSSGFWMLFAALLLMTSVVTGCAFHMVPLLTDRGMAAGDAAKIAALAGVAVLVSRFVTGFLLDLISARLIGCVSFLGATLGVWLVSTGRADALGVVLLGTALGVEGDLMAFMVRRMFGRRAYSEIYGYLWSAFNAGVLCGPILMGLAFDYLGSYDAALLAFVFIGILAAGLLLGAHPPRAVAEAANAVPA